MFMEHRDEQQLYHAIATVGTLLLQIGEVGKKFYMLKDASIGGSIDSDMGESAISDQASGEVSARELVAKTEDLSIGDSKTDPDISANQNRKTAESTNHRAGGESDLDSPNGSAEAAGSSPVSPRAGSITQSQIDLYWSVTFEQFLASMLTEPALVNFFEEKVDLAEPIEKFRNRRLYDRSNSESSSPGP